MINLEFEAYSEGRACYHSGVTDNPYDVETQYSLWEAWFDGFVDEHRRDTEAKIGECSL